MLTKKLFKSNFESIVHLAAMFLADGGGKISDETHPSRGTTCKPPHGQQPERRLKSETLVCVQYYNPIYHLTKYQHALWVLRSERSQSMKISAFQWGTEVSATQQNEINLHSNSHLRSVPSANTVIKQNVPVSWIYTWAVHVTWLFVRL